MDTAPALAPGRPAAAVRNPLLHPRLAALDPAVAPDREGSRRAHRSRLGLLAGTLGTCLTITFAAHAFEGAAPVAWESLRPAVRAAQVVATAPPAVRLPA